MKTRLFIGNLAATVTEAELRDKFEALLSSHSKEAQVGDVEVRCKNENNYFGYVDVYLNNGVNQDVGTGTGAYSKIPIYLRKCIDLMNNTKWKGSLIKVQPAKESFIEKLRKEQATRVQNDADQPKVNDTEQSRNSRQADEILQKLNKSKEKNEKWVESHPLSKPDNNGGHFEFEIVDAKKSNDRLKSPSKDTPRKVASKKRKKKNASSSSDDSSDSDDDVRDGIPKFKGLMACYPNGPPPPLTTVTPVESKKPKIQDEQVNGSKQEPKEGPLPIQSKLLSIAFDSKDRNPKPFENTRNSYDKPKLLAPVGPPAPVSSGINFKKSKQQKSDMLRMQSMEKLKELKTHRSNMISSSLSSVSVLPPATENRKEIKESHEIETKSKKPGMTLFDENDSDEEDSTSSKDGNTFNVKKQFEGEQGQRLLELQTRWGNDDRFRIDDRFKESDNEEEMEPVEKEKEKQLDILTDILGKGLRPSKPQSTASKSKTNSSKDAFSSVILPRYDPEADAGAVRVTNDRSSRGESPSKSKKARKEKDDKARDSDKQEEKPIRSTEPVTFKTVSNLKALFSSSGGDPAETVAETASKSIAKFGGAQPSSTSFSLLAAFGKADDEDDEKDESSLKKSSSSAPRSFWHSNPFRYDSSDDEDDDGKKDRVKVTINTETKEAKSNDLVIHGKTPFFFAKNDARFEGLEDYFLKEEVRPNSNENGAPGDKKEGKEKNGPVVEDFTVKRQELKAIVKAKIRNTKRKDEKRTLAIKRAIRKRKRKLHQRGRKI